MRKDCTTNDAYRIIKAFAAETAGTSCLLRKSEDQKIEKRVDKMRNISYRVKSKTLILHRQTRRASLLQMESYPNGPTRVCENKNRSPFDYELLISAAFPQRRFASERSKTNVPLLSITGSLKAVRAKIAAWRRLTVEELEEQFTEGRYPTGQFDPWMHQLCKASPG